MDKTLSSELHKAQELNAILLELTHQGKWDLFIEGMEEYALLLNNVICADKDDISADEQSEEREIIATLLANEALMMQRMRSRLDRLREEMSTLNKGKTASNAYQSSFTPSIR